MIRAIAVDGARAAWREASFDRNVSMKLNYRASRNDRIAGRNDNSRQRRCGKDEANNSGDTKSQLLSLHLIMAQANLLNPAGHKHQRHVAR